MKLGWLAVFAAACGDDPCDRVGGACLAIHVASDSVQKVDQVELDVLWDGDRHGTATSQTSGGGTHDLPIVLALELDLAASVPVGVVAAGKLSGKVLGTGAASITLGPAEHASIEITLGPLKNCMAGTLYCGGDKLAGDAQTLYECNGGGVPLARGRCLLRCMNDPSLEDYCVGSGGCVEGSDYCGGDKVDGDPKMLYRCTGGICTNPRLCDNGCIIQNHDDDICR